MNLAVIVGNIVFLLMVVVFLLFYFNKRNKNKAKSNVDKVDISGSLKYLKGYLNSYYVCFLDVKNPPLNPVSKIVPDSESYRQNLSKYAYPSDLIAYAQVKLYNTWSDNLKQEWDEWLLEHRAILDPYISGMVDDYKNDTLTMTDNLIKEANDKLRGPLNGLAYAMFDYRIDDNNTFAFDQATKHYLMTK